MRTERSIFEQAGLASGLLTEDQIDLAWHMLAESLPDNDLSLEEVSDRQLAVQLVELGHINQWQAEQLCQGRTKFTLGAYRILDAIGQGGMGWVFKGEHELLGRIEAIKVLPKSQTDANSISNFRKEIRAQARLDHPHLVRLTYADTDGDTYFLVTEYVPGSDLRRLVREHGPVSPAQAALIISQTAEALCYVHAQGLIHRDVKPGNLLITPEGHTKLADLGLAFFSSDCFPEESKLSQTRPKHIVGTADFLAPEIIVTPSEVRPISDIYSLGCTLYYAVTGKVPYPGGKTADKLRRHLDEVPIPAIWLNSRVDNKLMGVIGAMMQKRPSDRVATAAEVVELLRPWVISEESGARQTIGNLAKLPSKQVFRDASLADTKPVAIESEETYSQNRQATEHPARHPQSVENKSQSSAAIPAAPTESHATPLDRATRITLGLAIAAIVAAIYLVLFKT
ncbi:MAG: serine/threonine protein kinase [Planctomycetales bacterium]|nr:serine/threonine protein kinase [Planctomycetales bacterium]